MAVKDQDRIHFGQVAAAFERVAAERQRQVAARDPGDKMAEGLELSDFALRMAMEVRGDPKTITTPPEAELLAQGSLPRLWRERHPPGSG